MTVPAAENKEDWLGEVIADLGSTVAKLDLLGRELDGAPSRAQMAEVWRCYLAVEKSVAFVRIELDEENPGRFVNTKAYVVPDERQALAFAANSLRGGIELLRAGSLRDGLKSLRESRNYLRMLLRREMLARRRQTAAAAAKAPP